LPFVDENRSFYYRDMVIPEYAVDLHRNLRISNLQRFMQDTSAMQLAELDWPYEKLFQKGYVYLLTWYRLQLFRPIKAHESIRIYTWPRTTKGARIYRDFSAKDHEDKLIAEASTVWVLANAATHKIENPSATPLKELRMQPHLSLSIPEAAKIRPPKDMAEIGVRRVRYSDVDFNGHLTNSNYSDIFCDEMGVDLNRYWIQEYQVNFHKEALLGDVIQLAGEIRQEEDRLIGFLLGNVEDRACFDIQARCTPFEAVGA